MADDNANAGSLALLRQAIASKPLDVSNAPLAAGFGSPVAGLIGQGVKMYQAHQIRTKALDLLSREELARKFDQMATDPRYDRDIQLAADQHATKLRMHEVDKKLDKDYQPDKKDGTIPALNRLLYTWHARETQRRGGEPPPPEEPNEPPPPPNPGGMMPAPFHPSSIAEPPAAAPSPGIAAAPGGVQSAPGSISPGPAVPGVPATPTMGSASSDSIPAGMEPPPGPDYDLIPQRRSDMEQAQHEAAIADVGNLRPLTAAEATFMGKPELAGKMVHKDFVAPLVRGQSAINAANIRAETSLAEHGYTKDAEGHIVPQDPSLLSAKDAAYVSRVNSQVDLNNATAQWRHMMTLQGPARTRIAAEQAAAARQRADAAMKKAVEDVRQGMVKFPTDIVGGGYTMLSNAAQKSLSELVPRQREASELMQVFEPFKNDNQPFENAWSRFEYAFGRNPENAIGDYISEIELFRVQAAGALTKGQSRSLVLWERAALHTPAVAKDSPEQMYKKIQVIRKVLQWQADDAVRFGNKYGLVKLSDLADAGPYNTHDESIPPPPAAAPQKAASEQEGPPPINQREAGKTIWNSPKGLMLWTGKGWAPKAPK